MLCDYSSLNLNLIWNICRVYPAEPDSSIFRLNTFAFFLHALTRDWVSVQKSNSWWRSDVRAFTTCRGEPSVWGEQTLKDFSIWHENLQSHRKCVFACLCLMFMYVLSVCMSEISWDNFVCIISTAAQQNHWLSKPGVGNLRPLGRIRTARPFGTALEVIYKHTQKRKKLKKTRPQKN